MIKMFRNKFHSIFTVIVFLVFPLFSAAQEYEWEFKKETNGIKVYTRDIENTNLKALKIVMDVDISVNAIMRLLMDTGAYSEWVYKCSHANSVKVNSVLNTVDYYQIDFPWPFSDRDLYTNTVTTINHETGVITSSSTGIVDYAPERPGYVRVPNHFNQWIITPVSESKTKILYYLQSAPGGAIPNWLVNLAADQGPIRSMQAFMKRVKLPIYEREGEWLTDNN